MSKKLKMVLEAEPGTGKSTFAAHSDKPFFITTDGNFEWLDLPEKDHKQVFSWLEAKNAIDDIINHPEKYEEYHTIVVDLIEDLFKWCEFEYCKKNKLDHISDVGYAKGYDSTRNEFYIEMCKLLGVDKHILFLTHSYTKTEKDRRGAEFYKYYPSSRIPDKLWDMIEGRVRYFLRAYVKGEEENGRIVKRRYLSLIPKENEGFCIARGLDETQVPEDINLDWNEFVTVIGLNNEPVVQVKKEPPVKKKKVVEEVKPEVVVEPEEVKQEVEISVESLFGEPSTVTFEGVYETTEENNESLKVDEGTTEIARPIKEEEKEKLIVKESVPTPEDKPEKELTQAEKIARLKSKIMNNRK